MTGAVESLTTEHDVSDGTEQHPEMADATAG